MSDTFNLAIKYGEKILCRAKGDPAKTLAYAAVAAAVVVAITLTYGTYKAVEGFVSKPPARRG